MPGFFDFEGDNDRGAGPGRGGLGPDGLRIVVLDFFAGRRIEALGDVTEPDFEEIAQFGHRADGGARSFHRVGLPDGDGGTDVLDGIDLRLVEQVEELPGVGAESFDVAALALGVERVEYQRTFARAAQAGDGDVLPEGKIEVEALEVILADTAQADTFGRGEAGRFLTTVLTKRSRRKTSTKE